MTSYIVAPIPDDTEYRVRKLIKGLRKGNPAAYKPLLHEVVCELTKIGLEHHLLRPIDELRMGMLYKKISQYAITVAYQAILRATRRGIDGMSDKQLLVVADLLDETIIPDVLDNRTDKLN